MEGLLAAAVAVPILMRLTLLRVLVTGPIFFWYLRYSRVSLRRYDEMDR